MKGIGSRFISTLIVAVATSLIFLSAPTPAQAHVTGAEKRTIAGCNLLFKKAKRRACKRCIRRAGKHHYHPKARRCMRNRRK